MQGQVITHAACQLAEGEQEGVPWETKLAGFGVGIGVATTYNSPFHSGIA
jgi:hypothetical protein